MEKITIKDVRSLAEHLNKGRDIKIDVHRRYDYIALDLLDSEGNILDVLMTGLTKKEAYSILSAIQKFIWVENTIKNDRQKVH